MSRTADELPRLASPGSIAELSELMARAHAEARTVTVFGGGTAFDDHPPAPTPGLLIDLTGLAEAAEPSRDHPSLRAGAGVSISALNGIAAATGREILPDLPADRIESGSSLGGMIATAAIGPRHLRRPHLARSLVSVTSVGADGTIARTTDGLSAALAGRDLPGLMVGSWGTRAIIAEAEIRLTPRPESQGFVWIPGAEAAAELLSARRVPQTADTTRRVPQASDTSNPAPEAVVVERPPGSPAVTVVLVEGQRDEVDAQIGCLLDRFPGATACARPQWWARRARLPVMISVSAAPDFLPGLLETISRLEDTIGYPLQLRGSAAGRFDLGLDAPEAEPGVATRVVLEHLRSFGLHRISARLLHAPGPVWDELDPWGPLPGKRSLQEIKDDLDPRGLLSPGRGLGGI